VKIYIVYSKKTSKEGSETLIYKLYVSPYIVRAMEREVCGGNDRSLGDQNLFSY